jgi:nitrate reductase NapE
MPRATRLLAVRHGGTIVCEFHHAPRMTEPRIEPQAGDDAPVDAHPSTRQEEFRSFLFFTVVMAPVLAIVLVAGYGFLVWIYQMLSGPPAS